MRLALYCAIIALLSIKISCSTVFTTQFVTSTQTILVTPTETVIVGSVTTQVSTATHYVTVMGMLALPRQHIEYSMPLYFLQAVPTTAQCLYVEKRLGDGSEEWRHHVNGE